MTSGRDAGGHAPTATPGNAAIPSGRRKPRATAGGTFVHALQGMLMGTADVIPGVSGGTMALILGIYERLVASIHEVAAAAVALVRGDRHQAGQHWRTAEFALLLPLGAGIVIALGVGSVVLPPLIETYPVVTSAVFFGLIAGALPIPWRRIRQRRAGHYALALVGAVAAFAIMGFAPRHVEDPALALVFGAAAVAICAMILPGVSGAYLLLVLGMYEVTLEAVRDLNLAYVAVFVAGAVVGLGAFSKVLSWLLTRRHDATMAVLVGLMTGALRRLWPWVSESGALQAPPDAGGLLLAAACAVIGIVVVVGLTAFGERSSITEALERH